MLNLVSPEVSMDSMLPHSESEGRSGLLLFLPNEKQMLRRRSREAKAAEWGWIILNRFPPSTGAACYFNWTWLFNLSRFSSKQIARLSFSQIKSWVALSLLVVCLYVRIGNISTYVHYMMFWTIQTIYFLWGYDPGNMSVSTYLMLLIWAQFTVV